MGRYVRTLCFIHLLPSAVVLFDFMLIHRNYRVYSSDFLNMSMFILYVNYELQFTLCVCEYLACPKLCVFFDKKCCFYNKIEMFLLPIESSIE